MKDLQAETLGRAIEAAYEDSVKTWRARYAPSIAARDLFAEVLRGVDVRIKIRPRGETTILVDIEPRRVHDAETYFYTLNRTPDEDTLKKFRFEP